jgi:hypothetical protein
MARRWHALLRGGSISAGHIASKGADRHFHGVELTDGATGHLTLIGLQPDSRKDNPTRETE